MASGEWRDKAGKEFSPQRAQRAQTERKGKTGKEFLPQRTPRQGRGRRRTERERREYGEEWPGERRGVRLDGQVRWLVSREITTHASMDYIFCQVKIKYSL